MTTLMSIAISILLSITYVKSNIVSKNTFSNFNFVSEACIEIINSCYSKCSDNIVLYGDVDNSVIHSIQDIKKYHNLVLLNSFHHNFVKLKYFRRSAIFVIVVNEYEDFEHSLKDLRNYALWDSKRPYFVLIRGDNAACKNVPDLLHTTWSYNLLFSYLLCYENGQVMLWAFNPFVKAAPTGWRFVDDTNHNPTNPWTLFQQSYSEDLNINFCKTLKWDKTEKLNGYAVKAIGTYANPSLNMDQNNTSMDTWRGIDGHIMQTIFSAMDVTIIVNYNHNGNPTSMNHELAAGNQDLIMNSVFMRHLENTTIVPLNLISGIKFIVQKKNNMSTLKKIIRYLGFNLILMTIVITFLTVVVLRFLAKRPISMATLEIIRLLANSGLVKPPDAIPVRLYLGPVLFYYLSFAAIFQGELAALLTKPVPEINLNSPQDLKMYSEYNLYMAEAIAPYVDEEIQKISTIIPAISCEQYVLDDWRAVCITSEGFLMIPAANHDLHVPNQRLYANFEIYRTRKNWPLEEKFRKIVLSINQAGLLDMWKQRSMNYSSQKIKELEYQNNIPKFTTVTLASLRFAFEGLAYGLVCASFIYLLEIKIWLIVTKLLYKSIMFCHKIL